MTVITIEIPAVIESVLVLVNRTITTINPVIAVIKIVHCLIVNVTATATTTKAKIDWKKTTATVICMARSRKSTATATWACQ